MLTYLCTTYPSLAPHHYEGMGPTGPTRPTHPNLCEATAEKAEKEVEKPSRLASQDLGWALA